VDAETRAILVIGWGVCFNFWTHADQAVVAFAKNNVPSQPADGGKPNEGKVIRTDEGSGVVLADIKCVPRE
jgi:hypothetical protein